jgi:glycosyltransferase involved in cell wall biosynthesis
MKIVLTRREALDVPDGINIFLFSLADALQELGHDLTVVSTAANDLEKIKEYFAPQYWPRIISLGRHRTISYKRALLTWLTRGNKVIRDLDPDLVVLNGAVPLRFPGKTCMVSHDAEQRLASFPGFRRAWKKWCYGKADLVVATCVELQSALARDAAIDPRRIYVIPTCVKLETYRPRPFTEREDAILHMGTVDYKNPTASIRAFRHVAGDGRRLYITGRVTPELEKLLATLDRTTRSGIELLGFAPVSELLDLLGRVKVVSVPSVYSEPVASPTVLESLASGTPVVASTSISRQVLPPNGPGFICDPSDSEEMAAAYQRLLTDASTWQRMSAQAREVATQFSARRVAGMYLDMAAGRLHPSELTAGSASAVESGAR